MAGAELQLMVFDTRRGNREGGEDDKLLAFHPAGTPAVHQSGLAGLLQGLLLFTANFVPGAGRPRWDVAETDSGTWVMHEPEPHLWFAALAPHAWMPRHSTEHGLRALLVQAHRLASLLCGSVQGLLDQDPSGALARRCLQAVLQRLGAALASSHSWQHRELRNPLGDASLPPALQLPPSGALAVQSLANLALQAPAPPGEPRPVAGMLLLHGPHLLWSSLPPRDTAALFSLIATGLLHASASASGAASGGAASGGGPDLSALDGGCWQQLPSGFLALRGSLDADITGEGAPAVQLPLVHLQQPPGSSSGEDGGGEQQAAAAAAAAQRAPHQLHPGYCLLPLLEGKLLLGLLLAPGVPPTAQLLASLHALLAVPARLLAAQVGEEVRQAYRGEPGHLPGFRYLHQDGGRGVAHASPRAKVSAMSHHARTLAAALRTSLGRGPEAGDAEALDGGSRAEWADEGAPGGAAADGLPSAEQQQWGAASGAAGMQPAGDHEVLEVLAKSGQDVWAAAWCPGDGRQLLAVRERRVERELPEAGEAMAAFAARNFMI